jgi:hypothetical protein
MKTVSPEGNRYVQVMTDAYTKVVELDAIPNKSAETVARSFFEKWICRYSVPCQLISDNGKEYCNQVMDCLCDLLGIKHKTTTAYHPASNSSAESFNRSMKKYLTAMLDNDKTLEWEAQLPMLQLSYNTHVHQSTLESPFWLTYHMDPRLPYFDLEKPKPLYNASYSPSVFHSLSETHKRVHAEQWKARELRETYYNRKAKERSFDVGDRVLFYSNATPKNVNEKFYKHWQGPYTITQKFSPLNYEIKLSARAKPKTVHIEKLKPYTDEEGKKLTDSKRTEEILEELHTQLAHGENVIPAESAAHGELVHSEGMPFDADMDDEQLDTEVERFEQQLSHEHAQSGEKDKGEKAPRNSPPPPRPKKKEEEPPRRLTRANTKRTGKPLVPQYEGRRF